MGIIGDFFLGNALTKLTNLLIELDYYKERLPIGLGGGIDSLPEIRQKRMTKKSSEWLATLRKSPSGRVTAALLLSIEGSKRRGDIPRVKAQERLLEMLVGEDIALDPELLSYALRARNGANNGGATHSPSAAKQEAISRCNPDGFVVTPSLPNIGGMQPRAGYLAGPIMTLIFSDPQPIETNPNSPVAVNYHFAATQYDSSSESMIRILTLESIFGPPMLCTFERDGTHRTIGDGAEFITLSKFSNFAKREACKEASIPTDRAIDMKI